LNVKSDIWYLAFTTIFFDQIKNNDEIVVDATYKNLVFEIFFFYYYCILLNYSIFYILNKTNTFGFELYAVIGQINGCGYPMAYLFLDNVKKNDGMWKAILVEYFQNLKECNLQILSFFWPIKIGYK
jgi:hypothetical protein